MLILLGLFLLACQSTTDYRFDQNLLTAEEKAWLSEHRLIKLAPAPYWPPIDIYEQSGTYTGISKDYLSLIEKALNITFVTDYHSDNTKLYEALKNRSIDATSAAAPTTDRLKYAAFTEPYLEVPVIILARSNFEGKVSEENLSQYKVAIGNNFAAHEFLKSKYPDISFLTQPSDLEVLEKLAFGEADLAVIDIADASYIINARNYNQLKVIGEIDYTYTCSFAIRSDYQLLVSSMNKVLGTLPTQIKNDIHNRWINIEITPFYKQKQFLYGLIGTLFVIIFIIGWNYALRAEVNRRTSEIKFLNSNLERRVEERTKELENLNHELDMHIDELLSTQQQLVEAEKYASLGRLVSGVAHKLNTPIGNIFTALSFQSELVDKFYTAFQSNHLSKKSVTEFYDANQEILTSYANSIEKLKRTIEDFKKLEYPNTSHYHPNTFNVFELLQKVTAEILFSANKSVDLQIECERDLLINNYYDDFEQIVKSIFENAVLHGFKNLSGGTIRIKAYTQENNFVLSIWNDGNTISSDAAAHIYTPFFTTDLQSCSGLGLSVVHNLIYNKFKGSIHFESSKETGTEFTVKMPLL
jgi:signal transduction histidine kinase